MTVGNFELLQNFSTTSSDTAPCIILSLPCQWLSSSGSFFPIYKTCPGLPCSKWCSLSPAISSGEGPQQVLTSPTHHGTGIRECPLLSSCLPTSWSKTWEWDPIQNSSAPKNRESPHASGGRSTKAKAKMTEVLLFRYIKTAIIQNGFGVLYLPCLRHSILLGISSLSEDRCLFLPRVWISYCLLHPLLHAKSLLSWPTCCDSRLISPQDSRQEHWSGLSCPPHIFHFFPSQIFTFISLSDTGLNPIVKCLEFV